jgi:peroxiredoxin
VQATPFELQEVRDGKKISLASLQGRPVVLNFWATWCPTCVAELPNMDRFHAQAKGRYVVLTISSESPYKLRDYIVDEDLQVPVLYDRGGRVSKAYAVDSIPTTVIIDGQGKLVHDFSGGADLDILREHIDRLIASSDG